MLRARAVIVAVLIVSLVGLVLWVHCCVSTSLEAEKTLQAYCTVLDALKVYARENAGNWPESWDDIAEVLPENQGSVFRWPEDVEQIRKRVFVDFRLTGRQVATMNGADFSAVQPIGPNYGRCEGRIEALLQEIRHAQK